MKRVFISIVCLFSLPFSAQFYSLADNGLGLPTDNALFNKVRDNTSSKSLSYDEIQGSPYLDKVFSTAKVAENYDAVPVRYNSFEDRIEFKKDDNIFLLPMQEKFYRIEFSNSKKVLALLETNDELKGYFYELVSGEYGLYRKNVVKFVESTPARNTYSSDKPAYFKNLEPIYYIKVNSIFIKNPKNLKTFLTQYTGGNKDEISAFVKDNKIKFDSEIDLIKLVEFLNKK